MVDAPGENFEATLHVGVSEESQRSTQVRFVRLDIRDVDQVFIFIERGAVHEIETLEGQRALRHLFEVEAGFFRNGPASPDGGEASGGVKQLKVVEAAAGAIVVAADDGGYIFASPFHDGVRVGAIAYQVAEAQDFVVTALRVGEDGLEGFEIAVNIAKDQVRHRRSRATSGGAPRRAGSAMVPIPRDTKIEEPFS